MLELIIGILILWTFFGGIAFGVIMDFPNFVNKHEKFVIFISGPLIWITALFILIGKK